MRRTAFSRIRPHAARAAWAISDALIGPVLLMLIAPLLLQALGVGGFGIWAFAIAIAGFGQLASVGVGVTATKHVSSDLGAGKPDQAIAATRAALSIALMGGGLLLLIVALIAPHIAMALFAKMGEADKVTGALILGVALMITQEVDGVFSGALRGAQRYDIAAKVELFSRPIWAVAVVSAAWIFKEPLATLTASLGVNLLKLAAKGLRISSVLDGNCVLPTFVTKELRRTIDFGRWVWVQGIGGILFGVIDRMLIGALFGAADLGRYSICLQLAQFVHSTQAAAFQVLMPWASEKTSKTKGIDIQLINRLACWGGLFCLLLPVATAVLSATILRSWIGLDFAVENSYLCMILLLAYGLLSFNIPCHFLLLGLGFARYVAIVNMLAGVLSILLSLLLLPHGLVAFAYGRLGYVPIIFSNFFQLKKSNDVPTDTKNP